MARHHQAPQPAWRAVLGELGALSLTVAILNKHRDADGLYTICGSAWPDEQVPAEHNYDFADLAAS
jgi:hypothetical protein